MSLIDEVMGVSMESSYNNNYYKGLNDPIDDTAESMLYASQECMVGIVAVEAAIATMEGQTAVAIMKTNDSYEKQRLVSTYEGFISDAWEKIKEWIRKAYETVKRWLQKVWNKIKQGADMVKAFFTKYGSVLREKDTSGLEVKWCEITLDGANKPRDEMIRLFHIVIQDLKQETGKITLPGKYNYKIISGDPKGIHGVNYVNLDMHKNESGKYTYNVKGKQT